MKNKFLKRLLFLSSLVCCFLGVEGVSETISVASAKNASTGGVVSDPTQYIGYGYHVAAGKAIFEPDALMLNNPILDLNKAGLKEKIQVFICTLKKFNHFFF
jgi:hypothetical protein